MKWAVLLSPSWSAMSISPIRVIVVDVGSYYFPGLSNLTELISPLNYTGLTWLNGEKRETELEQRLEEIENSPILSFS